MAFFGLTHLGHQNPIGDKLIVSPNGPSHVWATQSRENPSVTPELQPRSAGATGEDSTLQKAPPFSSAIHRGSHSRYQEMIKRVSIPRAPHELYLMPLTGNQQYGWSLSQRAEPWTQVKRFPKKNSEMTAFVEEITKSDPECTLF